MLKVCSSHNTAINPEIHGPVMTVKKIHGSIWTTVKKAQAHAHAKFSATYANITLCGKAGKELAEAGDGWDSISDFLISDYAIESYTKCQVCLDAITPLMRLAHTDL